MNWTMSPRVGLGRAGVGSAAGFFGIEGGFLLVPALMASTGTNLAVAQAASLLSVAAFGVTTACNYAPSGWVDPAPVAAVAVGGMAGTAAGLPLATRLSARTALVRRLLGGLLLAVAAYVAVRVGAAP